MPPGESAGAPSAPRRGRILGSVRNRLTALFFVISAAALGFVYLYVVPQIGSDLEAERLERLERLATEKGSGIANRSSALRSDAGVDRVMAETALEGGTGATLLAVRPGTGDARLEPVGAGSASRSPVTLAGSSAARAAASGEVSSSVESMDGIRIAEAAVPVISAGKTRWVLVLSSGLDDVDDAASRIRHQVLIAAVIALAGAVAAGWVAARAHARRLERLEAAAEKVAEGDFSTPIPEGGSDEVGRLATTLNEMQQRLTRLDTARAEFIANASHELRTPIFSLGGFVELLDEEEPDPAARAEFVRTMREQVARLTKLTADLLDLSKLDSGALQFTAEQLDLSEIATQVAEEFVPASNRRNSPVEVRASSGTVAMADANRVAQIMRILIDNALTHTPEGTTISIAAQRQDGTATLVVEDDGPGIGAHERTRVFDRFYTGDRVSGSGLGLAIARELTYGMGGELALTSREGHTRFTLRLPAPSGDGIPA